MSRVMQRLEQGVLCGSLLPIAIDHMDHIAQVLLVTRAL